MYKKPHFSHEQLPMHISSFAVARIADLHQQFEMSNIKSHYSLEVVCLHFSFTSPTFNSMGVWELWAHEKALLAEALPAFHALQVLSILRAL